VDRPSLPLPDASADIAAAAGASRYGGGRCHPARLSDPCWPRGSWGSTTTA